jgi:hypothetical protein
VNEDQDIDHHAEGLGLYGRLEGIVPDIEKAAALMIGCLRAGGKVMFAVTADPPLMRSIWPPSS